MPVPSLVTDLSTTVASNSPAGSENVFPNLDDYIRTLAAFLASIRDNSGNGWVSPYLPITGYSAGNVGIATATPQVRFVVDRLGTGFNPPSYTAGTTAAFIGSSAAGSPSYVTLISGNTGLGSIIFGDTDADSRGRVQYDHAADSLAFWTSNTPRATINSTGSVGIGTTDPTGGYGWSSAARILGIAGDASASTTSYGAVALANNRATPTATDDFGVLAFTSPNSVAGQTLKAFIKGTADGAGGVTGGYGGQLQFYTKGDNTASNAGLRMQLDAAGNVQIGTSTAGLGKLRVFDSGTQAIELTSNDSNAVDKIGCISISRYTNANTPFTLIRGSSTATASSVSIGGGTGLSANATDIFFYTGALSAVGAIGTERMRIRSDGAVVIGANADATLNMKAGTTGTTGAINWTFNTDSTVYGSLSLPFDTRATVGLKLESTGGYPITVNAGNGINFQEDGVTTVKIDSAGNVQVVSTGSLGYGTGSGGTVTQATSRTTGVTLNKTNGSITLVSAAGTTAWQSFTVTNSTVGATDVVHICQKSGTDLYEVHITAVAAGSFRVSFKTTSGTTTEQPVFNFVVISAATS